MFFCFAYEQQQQQQLVSDKKQRLFCFFANGSQHLDEITTKIQVSYVKELKLSVNIYYCVLIVLVYDQTCLKVFC